MKNLMKIKIIITAVLLSILSTVSFAQEDTARAHAEDEVKKWIGNSIIISAINAQNTAHATLDQASIDTLDKTWRKEIKDGGGSMTTAILGNKASAFLNKIKGNSDGLYTEIFLMDNKGLNVAQSDLTSDYWQGDEAKWQKTFKLGTGAIHISEVELDESSQTYQIQLSITVTDPATGKVIGAISIGMNAEML